MTHTKTKKRWANALIPVRTKCPRGVPPYIVLMHTAQDHAVNLHGRRQHTCGTVKGKNEGNRPPYGIGLCPIL